MAEYKVISQGFIDGRLRNPHDGVGNVRVEKAFKKCPSWLKEVKAETAAAKKKRVAAEAKASKLQDAETEEQQKMKDEMSFMDGHNDSTVETL